MFTTFLSEISFSQLLKYQNEMQRKLWRNTCNYDVVV